MRVFKEEQRFTQTWILVLMGISFMLPFIMITKSFLDGQIGLLNYLFILGIVLLSCGLIFIFKLITKIDPVGIHYRFSPLHRSIKTILWKDIAKAETRTYNALTEYGGWGLKGGLFGKKGIALNVTGNVGIQLVLKNNKRILIGTQKRREADEVISRYLHKS